jgi:hypothetical protein
MTPQEKQDEAHRISLLIQIIAFGTVSFIGWCIVIAYFG